MITRKLCRYVCRSLIFFHCNVLIYRCLTCVVGVSICVSVLNKSHPILTNKMAKLIDSNITSNEQKKKIFKLTLSRT